VDVWPSALVPKGQPLAEALAEHFCSFTQYVSIAQQNRSTHYLTFVISSPSCASKSSANRQDYDNPGMKSWKKYLRNTGQERYGPIFHNT
jgi:hypothetical protein